MKVRFVAAIAAVVVVSASADAFADILVVKVDPSKLSMLFSGPKPGGMPAGMGGGAPGPGIMGQPIGPPQAGGQVGNVGGIPGQGGFPGARFGQVGVGGGMPNPGAMVGGIPGGMGGGFPRAMIGGIPGAMGGGIPGAMMGGVPGTGNAGAVGGIPSPPEYKWLVAAIEIRGKVKVNPDGTFEFDHRWGKRAKFMYPGKLEAIAKAPAQFLPFQTKYISQKDSLVKEFEKQFKFKEKDKDRKEPIRWLPAAEWALRHGLTKEFHAVMDEFRKAEPKHPAVENYTRVQAAMIKPFGGEDPAVEGLLQDLATENYRKVPDDVGHYVVITNLNPSQVNDATLKRRLKSFEDVVENFYYWFALQPELTQPELPRHRLPVLLTTNPEDYRDKLARWGYPASLNGSFSSRRDNLMVVGAKRFDDEFAQFEKDNLSLWSTYKLSKDELVSGAVWDRPEAKNAQLVPLISAMQMLAITQKALEEDVLTAAFTHEGVRQLLVASGLVPRNVAVPDWYLSGMASFFETPNLSPHASFGVPNCWNLIAFKHYRKAGRIAKSNDTLMEVLTDKQFRQAQRTLLELQDASADKELLATKFREEIEIARASAWALVYHLAIEKKTGTLLKYGQELNRLPRDLDLEDRALQGLFARTFELADPRDPGMLDAAKTRGFAANWYDRMEQTILDVPELETEYASIMRQVRRKEGPSGDPRPTSFGPK